MQKRSLKKSVVANVVGSSSIVICSSTIFSNCWLSVVGPIRLVASYTVDSILSLTVYCWISFFSSWCVADELYVQGKLLFCRLKLGGNSDRKTRLGLPEVDVGDGPPGPPPPVSVLASEWPGGTHGDEVYRGIAEMGAGSWTPSVHNGPYTFSKTGIYFIVWKGQ